MNTLRLMILTFVLICGLTTAPAVNVPVFVLPADNAAIVIPFELVNRHIFLKIKVNNSDPLWFIFDTGGTGL